MTALNNYAMLSPWEKFCDWLEDYFFESAGGVLKFILFWVVVLVLLIECVVAPALDRANKREKERVERETGHSYFRDGSGKLRHNPSCKAVHTFPVVD